MKTLKRSRRTGPILNELIFTLRRAAGRPIAISLTNAERSDQRFLDAMKAAMDAWYNWKRR